MATTSAIPVIRKVPTTSGRTPKLAGLKSGDQSVPPRYSPMPTSPKKVMVSRSRERTIRVVVTIDRIAASISTTLIAPSQKRRLEEVRVIPPPPPGRIAEPASIVG